MKRDTCGWSVSAVSALVLALGCGGEAAVGVADPPPSATVRRQPRSSVPPQALEVLASAPGLLRCAPFGSDSVTTMIGERGGSLDVGRHRLTIPPGALDAPQAITAVVPEGEVNLVRFRPAGLRFARAASLKMSYENCVLDRFSQVQIGYVTDSLRILEYLVVDDQRHQRAVTGHLWHFSNYAVAW